jgi:hypothetical protein
LYSREHTFIRPVMANKCWGISQNNNRKVGNFVANILSDVFTYQTQKPKQDDTSQVATLTTPNAPVLSKVF